MMFKSHRGQKHALALCLAAHNSFDWVDLGIGVRQEIDQFVEVWFECLEVPAVEFAARVGFRSTPGKILEIRGENRVCSNPVLSA